MSRGVNKVILVGNIGNDPSVRKTANGNTVTSFSLATNEQWKDKTTGINKDKTEWHKIVTYGKLAEICAKFISKSSKVYVEGSISTRKWIDKDGIDLYATEIIAREIQLLGEKIERQEYNERETQEDFFRD